MTNFETLSLCVSVLAVVIAAATLMRQSKQSSRMKVLEEAQLRQQQATANLHEKQFQDLLAAGKKHLSAQLKLELLEINDRWVFRVTNFGSALARDVSVRVSGKPGDHNPIMEQDYNANFPAPSLAPGSFIDCMAVIFLGSPSSYNAIVSWIDPDGTRQENKAYVTL